MVSYNFSSRFSNSTYAGIFSHLCAFVLLRFTVVVCHLKSHRSFIFLSLPDTNKIYVL